MSFRYENSSSFVLKNINFSIKKQEKIAILGRTGSGKSSLLSILLRLYETSQGKIYFEGQNIK